MQHYAPYLGWIDHQKEHMKETVMQWANINSHAMNLEGLALQLNALKEKFASLNGQMQELTLPPFQYIDIHGNPANTPLGKALHITKRPDAKLRFFFSGHMDTVYGKNSPFQKVEQVDEQRIVGPGVTDMKGGLVILLTALEAFEKSPYAAEVGWEILISPDEEIGSPGSKLILERAAKRNHFGFIFEPSFADGAFVSERGGSMNLTIVVRGKSAHSGRDFAEGRSAIYALAPLIVDLEKLNTADVVVNVGTINAGGHTANVVPDLAISKVNLRAKEGERMQTLKMSVEELVKKHNNREGISIELHEGICRMPKKMDAATVEFFNWLEQTALELNHKLEKRSSGGVSDGNILAEHGLATIDSLGVVGGEIHSPREYLIIDSLTQRAKLVASFLMKIANSEFRIKTDIPPITL